MENLNPSRSSPHRGKSAERVQMWLIKEHTVPACTLLCTLSPHKLQIRNAAFPGMGWGEMCVCPHVHVHMTEFPLLSFLLIFRFLLSWEDSSDSVWPYPQIKLLVLVKSSAGRMAAQAAWYFNSSSHSWQQSIRAGTGYAQLTNIIHIFPNQLLFYWSVSQNILICNS